MLSPYGRMLSPYGRMLSPYGRMLSPYGWMLSPYGRMLSLSKHRPPGGPSTGSGTTPLTPQSEGSARGVL